MAASRVLGRHGTWVSAMVAKLLKCGVVGVGSSIGASGRVLWLEGSWILALGCRFGNEEPGLEPKAETLTFHCFFALQLLALLLSLPT
ncbi:hypothetical protein Syun_016984 [Stephania yunnanensis]|uniref:Uncharacterized protein n=1 Tax=Stephania yunnanensis TaxID=152371 RepID=A0AAP0J5S0_9MAGN